MRFLADAIYRQDARGAAKHDREVAKRIASTGLDALERTTDPTVETGATRGVHAREARAFKESAMRTQLVTWAAAVTLIAAAPGLAVALDPVGAVGSALGGQGGDVGGALGGAAGAGGLGAAVDRGVDRAGEAVDRAVDSAVNDVGKAAGAIGGAVGGSGLTGGAADAGRGIGGAARDQGGNLGAAGGNVVGGIGGNAAGGSESNRGGAAAGASGRGGTAARGRNAGETGPNPAAVTGTIPIARAAIPGVEDPPVIIRLPLVLFPDRVRSGAEAERVIPGLGTVRGPERVLRQLPRPLSVVPGVARQSVDSCRNTIAAEAKPHGAVRVEAVSAGAPTRVREGITRAPIEARIVYARAGRVQVRQARITCQLNAQGRVISLV